MVSSFLLTICSLNLHIEYFLCSIIVPSVSLIDWFVLSFIFFLSHSLSLSSSHLGHSPESAFTSLSDTAILCSIYRFDKWLIAFCHGSDESFLERPSCSNSLILWLLFLIVIDSFSRVFSALVYTWFIYCDAPRLWSTPLSVCNTTVLWVWVITVLKFNLTSLLVYSRTPIAHWQDILVNSFLSRFTDSNTVLVHSRTIRQDS
jgi:hypothetical protein